MEVKALGTGGAFSGLFGESRGNTCFVLNTDKKYLIDVPKDLFTCLREAGEDVKKIDGVFLTHIHDDHVGDLGSLLFEKYFVENSKLNLYTSKEIYESVKRRYADSHIPIFNKTDPSELLHVSLEDYINFIEISPDKDYENDGLKVQVRSSWHPVPTLGLKFTYDGKKLGYSGDTKFGPSFIDRLCADGKIDSKQCYNLQAFLWDADLVIHEVVLGPATSIHTNLDQLKLLPDELRRKILLVHSDDITDAHVAGTGIRVMERYKTYEI
ncbi:MAG: MBL fold metallo-hydrolase [Candidatus Nanoarchaeia archaeon]